MSNVFHLEDYRGPWEVCEVFCKACKNRQMAFYVDPIPTELVTCAFCDAPDCLVLYENSDLVVHFEPEF